MFCSLLKLEADTTSGIKNGSSSDEGESAYEDSQELFNVPDYVNSQASWRIRWGSLSYNELSLGAGSRFRGLQKSVRQR